MAGTGAEELKFAPEYVQPTATLLATTESELQRLENVVLAVREASGEYVKISAPSVASSLAMKLRVATGIAAGIAIAVFENARNGLSVMPTM